MAVTGIKLNRLDEVGPAVEISGSIDVSDAEAVIRAALPYRLANVSLRFDFDGRTYKLMSGCGARVWAMWELV